MNIYEIAEKAGVSISTVSRVLNSPEKVSERTRQRVQMVLKENYYVPNAMARGLVKSSMKNIGILASDISNVYFSTSTQYLESAFFDCGYTTTLCLTGDETKKQIQYIRILSEKKVDGLVLVGSVFLTPDVQRALATYLSNTPIVVINGQFSGNNSDNIYNVSLDHDHGARLIVDHLISRGYENIYFICATSSQNTANKVSAFLDIMAQYKLPIDKDGNVLTCERSFEGVEALARSFLPRTGRHTAVIFHDDLMAGYGCNVFQQLGCSIPGDVAIVGYDNTYLARIPNPQITSLDTKIEALARLAANTLQDILTQKAISHGITILPELVVRSST